MRSSFLVLLAVALVLVAFAPVASADVNLTIWNDKQCTQSAQVATIPCSSTLPPTCVKDPSSQSSGTFYCSSVGGSNNITWAIWASVSDCSGTPDETLTSYGPDSTCGTLIVTAQGQTYQIPATITNLNSSSSSSSSSKAKAAPATPLTALLNTAKYATAKTPARLGARRGLDKLFGRKQLNAL